MVKKAQYTETKKTVKHSGVVTVIRQKKALMSREEAREGVDKWWRKHSKVKQINRKERH